MSKPAIIVDGISKKYRLGLKEKSHQTFRDAATGMLVAPIKRFWRGANEPSQNGDFWALKDVSFEVEPGEVVGIIGRNGAGKSTLLKILSRITEPTSGEIRLRGRVASLLEVGTGFHPELTGRENIYLNGVILGMKQAEIRRKFDEIVDFAEVEKFLDTPVKYYSSGMYVRLAFAVAAHLEPEILIVDEVLAVGDAEFQKKCLGKMRDVARGQGRTVLFVSHNMAAIRSLCTAGVVLHMGSVQAVGDAQCAIERYLQSAGARDTEWRRADTNKSSGKPLTIDGVRLCLTGAQPRHELLVDIDLTTHDSHPPAFVAVDVFDRFGSWLMQAVPTVQPVVRSDLGPKEVRVSVELPPLVPGTYRVGVWFGPNFSETLDEAREVTEFVVHESPTFGRTVAHHAERGFIVPVSQIEQTGRESTWQ